MFILNTRSKAAMVFLFGCWLLCCICPTLTMGITYYISPSGDDSQTGTSIAQAWQTPAKVSQSTFSPGDSILFEGGQTFVGSIKLGSSSSGTPTDPVLISSYGTGRAILSSPDSMGISLLECEGIEIRNLNVIGSVLPFNDGIGILVRTDIFRPNRLRHIVIDSVEIRGFNLGGILVLNDVPGSLSEVGYEDVVITYVEAHHNGDHGIAIQGKVPTSGVGFPNRNVYIAHCEAHHNLGTPIISFRHSGNGIVVGNTDGVTVEYCLAYENGGNGIYPDGGPVGIWIWDSRDGVIQYCESHHNHTGTTKDGGGFDLDGGCINSVIQYCYSHDNDGPGLLVSGFNASRPLLENTLRFNISENDARKNDYGAITIYRAPGTVFQGLKVYHNTVYLEDTIGTTPKSIQVINNGYSDIGFYNNLFLAGSGVPFVDNPNASQLEVMFIQNSYYSLSAGPFQVLDQGTTFNSLANWQTVRGQEMYNTIPVGFTNDPQLKDPGAGITIANPLFLDTLEGYRPLTGSPIINQALDLITAYSINIGTVDFFDNSLTSSSLTLGAAAGDGAQVPLPLVQRAFQATRLNGQQVKLTTDFTLSERPVRLWAEYRYDQALSYKQTADFERVDQTYQLVHPNNFQGETWYRLAWEDIQGETYWTEAQRVSGEVDAAFQLQGVGSSQGWNLTFSSSVGRDAIPVEIRIANLEGKEVYRLSVDTQQPLNLAGTESFVTGMYVLEVRTPYQRVTQKVWQP
ncbi:MAG: right-handed parallel beta-helix repeat-containing protein [Bacteroidota bacterium]